MNTKKIFAPILIILLVVVGSGVYVYTQNKTKYISEQNSYNLENKGASKIDPACNGDKNEYAMLGFGVEHTYEGEITSGKKVKIVLSCDHRKFTITGAVNQVITSEVFSALGPNTELGELADLVAGSQVVDVNTDYNFDGYNDLSSMVVNGSQFKSLIYFLYDIDQNNFVFNKKLSKLVNVSVDKNKKRIESSDWRCGDKRIYWYWKKGNLLQVEGYPICDFPDSPNQG